MSRLLRLLTLLSVLAVMVPSGGRAAMAKDYVDLELVLAVDVSLSMDEEEQRLQRDGYVAAFLDPGLMQAIKAGPNGRIAVTYMEWAGAGTQSIVMPWRVISSSTEARAFASELAAKPIQRARMTSISGAIEEARALFAKSPVRGIRRAIDVSGDGPNNSGGWVEEARDRAVKGGIVINGLAIRIKRGFDVYSFFDLPDLDKYYKDCVIGGPGSFVLSIREKSEFATAIRQKLLLEIAGRDPVREPRLQHARYRRVSGKYDCLVGEKRWQEYRRDGGDQW